MYTMFRNFIKGFAFGFILWYVIKFAFTYLCMSVVVAVASQLVGRNLVCIENVLLVWFFWVIIRKLFK